MAFDPFILPQFARARKIETYSFYFLGSYGTSKTYRPNSEGTRGN